MRTRNATVFQLTGKDIGKVVSFGFQAGSTRIEVRGKLGGVEEREITVKDARCRVLPRGEWQPSQQKNPAFVVPPDTMIVIEEGE